MTYSLAHTRHDYAGDGATVSFPFTFRIYDRNQARVVLVAADKSEALQTIDTHYTVSDGPWSTGGNITMNTAPASGTILVIKQDVSPIQGLDLINKGTFPSEGIETSLDRMVILAKQNRAETGRAILAPEHESAALILPHKDARKGKGLKFDGDGKPMATTTDPDSSVATALTHATAAEAARNAASTSETNAAASAANAATSASNAGASAANAATSETNAATSATAAAASAATAAENVTFEVLDGKGDVGTGADQVARGDHLHDAIYVAKTARVVSYIPAGQPIPDEDVGPILVEDFRTVMFWTVFDNNGASFQGYASPFLGSFSEISASTSPPGWVLIGATNLSQSTFSALWNYARHHLLLESLNTWSVGKVRFADNGDGTFRTPNLQGYFRRTWPGGGVDPGRSAGSVQGDAIREIYGSMGVGDGNSNPSAFYHADGVFSTVQEYLWYGNRSSGSHITNSRYLNFHASRVHPVASEVRPHNTAIPYHLCCI
uniref:Phage Tail Collar Domain n=1 Tax=Candidatus Kentrum sp. UNK TaxID=2126344 RepID=A0A450ZYL6_9GAMM|nr:MAG: hypothetical protein BECKUNK1418G_GA0071005_100528 [Candidatus Kentron sp. UNK]VFK68604.1 MAG: hypothetical protein BECKUNK1418H_GA0071006_100428 [Candidatus Kentron sp. UNK]